MHAEVLETAADSGQNGAAEGTRFGLTTRALIIGLVMTLACTALVLFGEQVRGTTLGFLQFPPAAVAALLVVTLLNLVLRNLSPRLALRPPEVVAVYAMSLVATLVTSTGVIEKWIWTLVSMNYHANAGNHWATLMFPSVAPWAVP